MFPVACTTSSGVVRMEVPLLFVSDLRPTTDYGETAVEIAVEIAPTIIDLTGTVTSPVAHAAAGLVAHAAVVDPTAVDRPGNHGRCVCRPVLI
jgi:hypothetical protein